MNNMQMLWYGLSRKREAYDESRMAWLCWWVEFKFKLYLVSKSEIGHHVDMPLLKLLRAALLKRP